MEHSGIAVNLLSPLSIFVRGRRLGRVYGPAAGYFFRREPDTVRAPDVTFIQTERLPGPNDPIGYSPVVPDSAVEVKSPNDTMVEIAERIAFFLDRGVSLVWAIYPRTRTVVVHRAGRNPLTLDEGDTPDGEAVVPGFRLPVAELFA
jgi:Uma2 family endonuclease